MFLRADSVLHPPSGSTYPGMQEANPYMSYPPKDLRSIVETEKDPAKLEQIKSALRQWERIYQFPGYPWRLADCLRVLAGRLMKAELDPPAINIPYYQDSGVPQGLEEIIDSLRGLYDNYDMEREDYNRQGERPFIDNLSGDFRSPSEPPMGDVVKERGEGPDPDLEVPFPPTGGDIDRL